MATSSSILAWEIPWTEEPGGLQSMGSKKVRLSTHIHKNTVGFSVQKLQLAGSRGWGFSSCGAWA